MKVTDFLTERQRLLLSLTQTKEYSPQVFENLDIDRESTYVLRALAYIASENGWKDVPERDAMRLKGMMKCYHIKFLASFLYVSGLLECWNRAEVRYFIFRNAALKVGGYTGNCVPVGNISVFVHPLDRKKAVASALQAGFRAAENDPDLFVKETSGLLFVNEVGVFAGEDPEKFLLRAELCRISYQHDRMLGIPVPAPRDLKKMLTDQITGNFCNSLDRNELFYLLWIRAVIDRRAGLNACRQPEVTKRTGELLKYGMTLKEKAEHASGFTLFGIKGIRKVIRICLGHLFRKGRLWEL